MGLTATDEALAAEKATAETFLERIRVLMHENNAFRGKVVAFSYGMRGDFDLKFVRIPTVQRHEVVLDEGKLPAIEAHTIGITRHAQALREAGQHVKRGLLLYGPPGAGKSHTIAYLTTQMTDRTTIVLSGSAIGAIGRAGTIARELQPATIVIEDVDLIAMDRQMTGPDQNPLLFQLLNEMDGLGADADVLFILTTNRVDVLEPALTARPGRIDQAIEIPLPDADLRRELVRLYHSGPVPDNIDEIVDRLAGAAPAFIKELARRAQLLQLNDDVAPLLSLPAALDAMIENATPFLRRSLAAPD